MSPTRRVWAPIWGAVMVSLLFAPASAARPDDRVDPATGRDRANWPPPTHFDFRHVRVEIDLGDFTEPKFRGKATHRIAARGSERGEVVLNARSVDDQGNGIGVSAVSFNGARCAFIHTDDVLRITLPRAAKPDVEGTLVVEYVCTFPNNQGNGLTWSRPQPDADCPSFRFPMIHSQGQPESNRRWIPGHDFPNERLSSELIATVPEGISVVSNGRLIDSAAQTDGRVRWHWLQEQEHSFYLISLVAGQLKKADIAGPGSERPGVPMTLWGFVNTLDETVDAFAVTPAMVAYFEQYFDEPYPWDKYDQVIVRDFKWGAMENTSASTFYPAADRADAGDEDDIIAHELVHQWTGDLVTCKSWEHLWLNEGWASYGEALWAEWDAVRQMRLAAGTHTPPDSPSDIDPSTWTPDERAAARRAYLRKMSAFLGPQRGLNRSFAPDIPGMASNRYNDPEEPFVKANDVYGKGAIVLHMLRQRLGDEIFLRGVRLYIDRFRQKTVETDDFRKCLEEASGQSLERFFEQWVRRPGLPRVELDLAWDPDSSTLKVVAEQVQRIDADNPAYALVIPIYARADDGGGRWIYLSTDARSAEVATTLPARPASVSLDPNLTVGGTLRIRTPLPE